MHRYSWLSKIFFSIISVILLVNVALVPVLGSGANNEGKDSVNQHDTNTSNLLSAANVFLPLIQGKPNPDATGSWPMVAANPERTSWTPEEVTGDLHIEWYRPIEAYIPQNSQIIASDGLLYVSTSNGLYALDAYTGDLVWRYDTELPLGNSPTVSNGVVYVGGYDRKLHALDATTGEHLWAFTGAQAGFDTNPLVVDEKVIMGNRDGNMYAIGAHGSPNQGELIWKYTTGGSIHLSAAYRNGIIYFASDDNYAYALRTVNGELVWKSQKLPGDGYHSYWPVIFEDKVIFSASSGYRAGLDPGTKSVQVDGSDGYEKITKMDKDSIWLNEPDGSLIGPEVAGQEWAHGYPVLDASRITQYLEINPLPDPYRYKPWRRVTIVLNIVNGSEYTFDSDSDGYPEHLPNTMWGTYNGNRYPPLVGSDGILYQGNIYQKLSIPQGRIMGWNPDYPAYLSVLRGQGAIDEPIAISSGGSIIYRSICCDRVGDWFSILDQYRNGTVWNQNYPLEQQAPGYDEMWIVLPGLPRLIGWYRGTTQSVNAAYHNHGDQNPIIPYNGNLYIHRSNAVIAFGTDPALGKKPLLEIQAPLDNQAQVPSVEELIYKLEIEVEKIVDGGHLKPGYVNPGTFAIYPELADYFINPGDTLYTLSLAYEHLNPELQQRVIEYLHEEFQTYFDPNMYSTIGWANGNSRDALPYPQEVQEDLINFPPSVRPPEGLPWYYPQYNFYAMWLYATIFPEEAVRVYELARSRILVPVPDFANIDYFQQKPYTLNGYISGYIGFLKLQELAGMNNQDQELRVQVQTELDNLFQLLVSIFSKDSFWGYGNYSDKKVLDIARNFIYLTPELGDYLNQNILAEVQETVSEYEYISPYWFVARYEASIGEGVISNLYNYHALFQAKALILKQPTEELAKYLDVPAFERGDLFYIQNLIALIKSSTLVEGGT